MNRSLSDYLRRVCARSCELLVALASLSVALSPAEAQQSVLALEFSFSNPGARSMGFGGAFAGLADDATAAFANPAGLVQIARPEVSAVVRKWSYEIPFSYRGRVTGEPTGMGLDSVRGLQTSESSQNITGLSFVSVVYPQGRWSWAVHRHESAKFSFASATQGLFIATDDLFGTGRLADQRSELDFEIETVGLTVAYRLSDAFSIGLGVAHHRGSIRSVTELFAPDEPTVDGLFRANSYLPERRISTETFTLDDSDVRGSLGLLWKSPGERWRVGSFLRPGPRFVLETEARSGPALTPESPDSQLSAIDFPVGMPDVYGVGVAYRSGRGRLTLSLEWDRVEYTDLLDGLNDLLIEHGEKPEVAVEDGDEWHLGDEYAWLDSRPIVALRFGVWRDPDHRFRAAELSVFEQALRQPGEDELHATIGFGVAFSSFQIDLAGDFSDPVDTTSLSAVYSF